MNGGTQEQYPGSAGQLSLRQVPVESRGTGFHWLWFYLPSADSIALGLRQGRNVVVGECDEGLCLLHGMQEAEKKKDLWTR